MPEARRSPGPFAKTPYGWSYNLLSGLFIVGAALVATATLHRTWSWPLFAWGATQGLVTPAWAFYSSKAFRRSLLKRTPLDQAEPIRARDRATWERYRFVYVAMVLMGVGLGIFAAGARLIAVDIAFTSVWIFGGVLLPLVVFRRMLRGIDKKRQRLVDLEGPAV